MFRSAITRQARLFSTQAPLRKSVLDTAKETLQSANKAVGETLAKGIDSAESATTTSDAKAKADELAGKAKGAASEMSGEASGKASELQGKAKGMAEESKQKMS